MSNNHNSSNNVKLSFISNTSQSAYSASNFNPNGSSSVNNNKNLIEQEHSSSHSHSLRRQIRQRKNSNSNNHQEKNTMIKAKINNKDSTNINTKIREIIENNVNQNSGPKYINSDLDYIDKLSKGDSLDDIYLENINNNNNVVMYSKHIEGESISTINNDSAYNNELSIQELNHTNTNNRNYKNKSNYLNTTRDKTNSNKYNEAIRIENGEISNIRNSVKNLHENTLIKNINNNFSDNYLAFSFQPNKEILDTLSNNKATDLNAIHQQTIVSNNIDKEINDSYNKIDSIKNNHFDAIKENNNLAVYEKIYKTNNCLSLECLIETLNYVTSINNVYKQAIDEYHSTLKKRLKISLDQTLSSKLSHFIDLFSNKASIISTSIDKIEKNIINYDNVLKQNTLLKDENNKLNIDITEIKNKNQNLKLENYEIQLKYKHEKEKFDNQILISDELSRKMMISEDRNKNLVSLINELEKKKKISKSPSKISINDDNKAKNYSTSSKYTNETNSCSNCDIIIKENNNLKREIISLTKQFEKKEKKLNHSIIKKEEIINKLDKALVEYERQLENN